jgi:DNA-binding transcriptional MerR regulator
VAKGLTKPRIHESSKSGRVAPGRSQSGATPRSERDATLGEERDRADANIEATLSVGELAKAAGTTLRTVRFYEEQGVLLASERTLGHHRRFEASELLRLRIVLDLRGAGLSLDEIRAMMATRKRCRAPGAAARELAVLLQHQTVQLEAKIALSVSLCERLRRAKERLSTCSTCKDTPRFLLGCDGCDILETTGPGGDLFRLLWSDDP